MSQIIRKRMPATHLNIMYFLTLIIGALGLLGIYESTNAMQTLERLHCDYVFSNYASTQIDRKDYPNCIKRFDYLTKRYITNS